MRLQWDGEIWSAGQFLPWIHRVRLSGELDRAGSGSWPLAKSSNPTPLAINLSVSAVDDHRFINWIEQHLTTRSQAISNLWIEIPEAVAFRHLENFKRLATRIKSRGGHVGIEHIGHQLAKLGHLHDVGLDYLKVDASFVRDIQGNSGNQTLLRTLCTLGHAMGVSVIAEGVRSDEEWRALQELGIDGATGPGVSLAV